MLFATDGSGISDRMFDTEKHSQCQSVRNFRLPQTRKSEDARGCISFRQEVSIARTVLLTEALHLKAMRPIPSRITKILQEEIFNEENEISKIYSVFALSDDGFRQLFRHFCVCLDAFIST